MIKFNYFIFAFFCLNHPHNLCLSNSKTNEIDEGFLYLILFHIKSLNQEKLSCKKRIIKEVKKPGKKIEQKKLNRKK